MSSRFLTNESIQDASWCDVVLLSVAWTGDHGKDLKLEFSGFANKQGPAHAHYVLRCQMASSLSIDLNYKKSQGGRPMTWDASFSQINDHLWSVSIDFASAGGITLNCSSMTLEIASDQPSV